MKKSKDMELRKMRRYRLEIRLYLLLWTAKITEEKEKENWGATDNKIQDMEFMNMI